MPKKGHQSRKMDGYLVSASSAAVLTVFLTGYSRTYSSAEGSPTVLPKSQTPMATRWKDGTYTGWGYSRHGNIEATVSISGGKIATASISKCLTRYPCAVIDKLPPQVAKRQSVNVDFVSGATQSADAFYEAVVAALGKAR
jgi:uncharacterized protein with FMN-binding domain